MKKMTAKPVNWVISGLLEICKLVPSSNTRQGKNADSDPLDHETVTERGSPTPREHHPDLIPLQYPGIDGNLMTQPTGICKEQFASILHPLARSD